MIAALVALAVAASPQPTTAQDIVIVAKRFDGAHGVIKKNLLTGRLQCQITSSSGDPVIDDHYCRTASYCVRSTKARAPFNICMADGKRRFLAAWGSKRNSNAAN